MTAFVIPEGAGAFGAGTIFSSDTAAADSLVLNSGSFAISTGSDAVFLGSQGAWTVTIGGSVLSTAANKNGISLAASNPAASKITISESGVVDGGAVAIALGSSATLINKGRIGAGFEPSKAFDDFGVTLFGAVNTITNSGTIVALFDAISISASGKTTITNTNTIQGGIRDVTQVNNVTLTNSGFIDDVVLGGNTTTNKITNSSSGFIGAVTMSAGTNTLSNSGNIEGEVLLGTGKNTVTNSGLIGKLSTSATGIDIITNSGEITQFVDLKGGDDSFKNTGKFEGLLIDLGDGNDQFTGGSAREAVFDNGGADKYNLGGGNDRFIVKSNTPAGIDFLDTIDGGAGDDSYSLLGITTDVFINIDNVSHSFGVLTVTANKGLNDTIKNFERVEGGSGSDIIFGSAAANILSGENGLDVLFGFAGNDQLEGDDGADALVGGAGGDALIGGAGADDFVYRDKGDSTAVLKNRDIIFGFDDGQDSIVLVELDANTKNGSGSNEAFVFIGSNQSFTGVAGQLRTYWTPFGHMIEGDTNGDKKADLAIDIWNDPSHVIVWDAGDFIL